MKVLIVDDNRSFLAAVVYMARDCGMDVDAAHSAEEALECVGLKVYDFILLDLTMPGYDGLWFLRHAGLGEATKVIVMSGYIPAPIMRMMASVGVCDYLHKPFDGGRLLQVLEANANAPACVLSTAV